MTDESIAWLIKAILIGAACLLGGVWLGRTLEYEDTRTAIRDSDLPQICKMRFDSVVKQWQDEKAEMRESEQE